VQWVGLYHILAEHRTIVGAPKILLYLKYVAGRLQGNWGRKNEAKFASLTSVEHRNTFCGTWCLLAKPITALFPRYRWLFCQIFTVDMGVPLFNVLVRGRPLQSGLQNLA